MANYVNIECPHTAIVTSERGVLCRFTTCISNANDFLEEIKNASKFTGEALGKAYEIIPQIKEHYTIKNDSAPVGFAAPKLDN